MIRSRLSSRSQTTIPQQVRAALRLRQGDEIAYAIEQDRVVLTRADLGKGSDDPFRTFSEWESEADAQAYADL